MRETLVSDRETFFASLNMPVQMEPQDWTEARLAARAQAKAYQAAPTDQSWRALWEASLPFAAFVCWHYWDEKCQHGRFVDDPWDLLGEVYLRARRYAESWRYDAGDWPTWLQNKARWDLTDLHRSTCKARQLQRKGRELVMFRDFDQRESPCESAERQAEIADEFNRVCRAMENLNSRNRDIIMRWSVSEFLKDIGVSLGISESRVSQLIKIGLKELKKDPFIESQTVGPPNRTILRMRRKNAAIKNTKSYRKGHALSSNEAHSVGALAEAGSS